MTTLKTTAIQQLAIQDNVRSAGLFKLSSGILIFVIMSALTLYLIRNGIVILDGLSSLFFVLPFFFLPLSYAIAGFLELVSGEPITKLSHRWKKYSIGQRRSLVVIVSFMSLISISIMTLDYLPSYLRLL